MSARFFNRDVATVTAAVVSAALLVWFIIFMVGDIAKMQSDYNAKIASENQQEQVVSEDMHEPMVIPEESVYDDTTGTYGQHIRPNGSLGTGYDMGGGVVMKPNGEIGFGLGL